MIGLDRIFARLAVASARAGDRQRGPATLDREAFVDQMADRFVARSEMSKVDALAYADVVLTAFLIGETVAFGADGRDWTATAAHALADADLEATL